MTLDMSSRLSMGSSAPAEQCSAACRFPLVVPALSAAARRSRGARWTATAITSAARRNPANPQREAAAVGAERRRRIRPA